MRFRGRQAPSFRKDFIVLRSHGCHLSMSGRTNTVLRSDLFQTAGACGHTIDNSRARAFLPRAASRSVPHRSWDSDSGPNSQRHRADQCAPARSAMLLTTLWTPASRCPRRAPASHRPSRSSPVATRQFCRGDAVGGAAHFGSTKGLLIPTRQTPTGSRPAGACVRAARLNSPAGRQTTPAATAPAPAAPRGRNPPSSGPRACL